MAMRFPHLFSTILWFSLFLLLFHCWCNFFSKDDSVHPNNASLQSLHQLLSGRKMLARNVDFSPFLKNHRHHRHHHHHRHTVPVHQGSPASDEIDPRYGVAKRLVPTGPNPLHH
ncbi:hypothetical protein Tsubulata_046397 [Turnera subulata]|uniref:Uncharacterized protein n=1 Tax=Turnera subulata TaxID=218843 RepID=A0A9Q0J3P2_9ROSI|nr:hypothetical protein Tsubulata_046397 [Turnera subulata]